MTFPAPKLGQICEIVIEFDKSTLFYINIVTKFNFFDSPKHFTIFWSWKTYEEVIILAFFQQIGAIFSKFCLETQKIL